MKPIVVTEISSSGTEILKKALEKLHRHPLEEVLKTLKECENEIYVWVITQPNGSESVSLKVPLDAAVDWCQNYAISHSDALVPCWYSGHDVFLGYPRA